MTSSLAANPELHSSTRLFVGLHELIRSGKADSHEADLFREQLDTFWLRLNPQEKTLARALSSDLHTVGRSVSSGGYDAAITAKVEQEFAREKWTEAIDLLRTNDSVVAPAVGAYLRGLYWAHSAFFDMAILFFQEARRLDPLSPLYEMIELTAYVQAGRAAEVASRAQRIASQSDDWVLVLAAAQILFVWADETPPQDSTPIHRQAIEAVRRGLALAGNSAFAADPLDTQWKFHRVNANLNLSLSCEQLGDTSAALQACEDALQIDPNNSVALMLYGWLKYPGYPTDDRGVFRDRMRRTLMPTDFDTHIAIGKA